MGLLKQGDILHALNGNLVSKMSKVKFVYAFEKVRPLILSFNHKNKHADPCPPPKKVSNMFDIDKLDENDIRKEYLCTISSELMIHPVIAADGYTYDRKSIEERFKRSNNSPMTGGLLPNKNLIPNHSLKSAIESWRDEMKIKIKKKRIKKSSTIKRDVSITTKLVTEFNNHRMAHDGNLSDSRRSSKSRLDRRLSTRKASATSPL